MKNNPILIVLGEPNSIFSEILIKTIKKKINHKLNKPIIIIGSVNLFKAQIKLLGYSLKFKIINKDNLKELKNKNIYFIDIKYDFRKAFDKISKKSNSYINSSFQIAFKLLRQKYASGMINGPISKKHFLIKKHLGITEFISKKIKSKKKPTMLIYNSKFSVCPVTTHLPINRVAKNLTKKKIINDILNIFNFYEKTLKRNPKIAVLGLNPHCETVDIVSEEQKVINPSIKYLKKKKIKIAGPFSADTFFSNENLKKYDVAVGMYHDQVLTPMKTLFKFDAINLTLGLPFFRVSPDHGINYLMIGKKKSKPDSLISCINFLRKVQ